MKPTDRILANLKKIYSPKIAERTWQRLLEKLAAFKVEGVKTERYAFTEKDLVLITYADQFRPKNEKALRGLQWFADTYLKGIFNSIHILPFFPYSSDDGFSVIDYYRVNPDFGGWTDVQALSAHFRLMVDGVFNHISRQSGWFQTFLDSEPPYTDYFISVPPNTDLSAVVRPRTSPLLTRVLTREGEKHVWTTFSDDQIDLNFASPELLLEIVDVLLFYIRQGARIIRIDAVPFLWKEIGTDCIHRPQTHALIKALRALLDAAAPGVVLITESNVPFEDNISYLGETGALDGLGDEAQLVYQFSLGPLVMHALMSGSTRVLSKWVAELPSPQRYFNFIASHDGIGLLPAEGILTAEDIASLIRQTEAHGGMLSYKTDTEGKRQVYELNITLYDFLNDPNQPQPGIDTARYLTSQAIMLELAGVPGVYVHSLFGSSNCAECFRETGRARSVNRRKFEVEQLKNDLVGETRSARILGDYLKLASLRADHAAFNPQAEQQVLSVDDRVFALLRHDQASGECILCLSNLSADNVTLSLDANEMKNLSTLDEIKDLIAQEVIPSKEAKFVVKLAAYQSRWLQLV